MQIKDFSGDHEVIAAVRYSSLRSEVPPGVFGCLLYKFDEDIAPDLMVEYRRVAKEVSEQYWIGEMPRQTLADYMAAIDVPARVPQRKPQQITSGPNSPPPDRDERVLTLEFRANGHRLRFPWRDVVEQLSEEPYVDWPLQGPRTTLLCCNFHNRRGGDHSTSTTGGSPSRAWHRTTTGWSPTEPAYKCWRRVAPTTVWWWRTWQAWNLSCAVYSSWSTRRVEITPFL